MKRLVATACLAAVSLLAQTNRGAISGTVTDQSGSVVPGASVTITNTGTNESRKITTGAAGTYSALDLDPVTYKVEVEMQGFKKAAVENVKVDTASTTAVNVTLQTGSVDTQVTVSAEVAMLNVESGTTSSTVTSRELQDVPLVNRSVLDLAMVQPNVSGDPGSENPLMVSETTCPGCNISVNGGRPLNTLMMADGTNNTGVSLARTMVSFSPETVQEFTVQTTAFSAEYSTTGGGVISATTKSGTNNFNGAVLWYNRNPDVAAAPWTNAATNRPYPTLKYNQFSLTAGGPVYIPKVYNGKNKTFWFAGFEPNYRRDHLDQYGLMPTDGMRTGDFSGLVNTNSGWLPQSVVDRFQGTAPTAVAPATGGSVIYQQYNLTGNNQFVPITLCTATITTNCQPAYLPFPGNKIPAQYLDASAQKAMQYIAPAGAYYLNSNGLISNISSPRRLQQDEKRYTIRVDQIVSDKDRLNVRYTATPIVKIQDTPVSTTQASGEYSWAKQAMLAYTRMISPTVLNDLRLNYTRGRFSNTLAPEWDINTGNNLNTILGLPSLTRGGVPGLNGLFPGSALGGGGSNATGLGGGGSTSVEDREERYALTDIFYKSHGTMSLKFGFDFSHALQNVLPLYASMGGQYNFSTIQTNSNGTSTGTAGSPFASFLLGVVNSTVTLRNAQIPYYYRWNSYSGFVQNDWKVRPNLTLNIGLRYGVQMPRTEKYDNQGVFNLDMINTFPLATPLKLQDGTVVNSVQAPAFAFSGRGGNSRYMTPTDYKNFEPRFGFAWSPRFLADHRVTLRGGYGLSHAPISGARRLPGPDFGSTVGFTTTIPSQTANPNYVMRLGENPPLVVPQTPAQVINAPASGLVTNNSLYYQGIGGFAVSPNYHTPYIQNWNLTISWQANPTTTMEIGYTGLKGTRLFMPNENINPKNSPLLDAQNAAAVNPTATIADPLGRINPATGAKLTVQNGSLGSPYLGFSSLYLLYDASANSIRHGGYVSVQHRVARGLTFTANYTWAKSIDDASNSGGDKNILTAVGGQTDGQVAFGYPRYLDRSVSTFDQRHTINGTVIYDLPVGRGRLLLNNAWKPLDALVGGWTVSGIERLNSGFPYLPYLSDSNQIGDLTHTARPDMLAGVPLVNPLWSSTCPVGNGCQPYVNPAAFMRPPLGRPGSAPRTLDGVRGPWAQYLDVSVQKSFKLGESGRRRLQFRADALNLLNHPIFRVYPNNGGGADFMGAPSTANLTTAEYDTWAKANNQPLYNTTAGAAAYNGIVGMINAQKTNNVLPTSFFNTPLPANFYGNAATSYDITTLQGYKYYRLRNAYSTTFGTLYQRGGSRYLQFGLKLFF
ncbi:MAG: carboxypeptidase regulatory-like domain-containing protein [Acidobacteria bacterium]|nr:carboxypeptidase regulatory-like domain-containing protein [Acidobacteriota bacterium]